MLVKRIDDQDKKVNFHTGHRARMKQRYLEQGIDSMEDHEVLEMLLYFALPQRDTNELAHRLLSEFGSLANVLEADVFALQQVNGVGSNTSFLLNFIPKLAARYQSDRWRELPSLTDSDELTEYIKTLFIGRSLETLFMVCLNAKGQVKNAVKLGEGTVGEVVVYTPKVVEAALQNKCRYVILAHNHPGGVLEISREDVDMTRTCNNALHTVGVKLLDHVIVCGNQTISLNGKNLMIKDY